jgi:hypothetical protein
LTMKCLLDYDYGSALGGNSVHPSSESANRQRVG